MIDKYVEGIYETFLTIAEEMGPYLASTSIDKLQKQCLAPSLGKEKEDLSDIIVNGLWTQENI